MKNVCKDLKERAEKIIIFEKKNAKDNNKYKWYH